MRDGLARHWDHPRERAGAARPCRGPWPPRCRHRAPALQAASAAGPDPVVVATLTAERRTPSSHTALGAHHIDAVTDEQADAIHHAYFRLEMVRSLTDAIVAQAAKDPRNAPRYSIPGEFLRERWEFGQTRLEHACRSSRWGS
ncbi:hypothetical protein [Streptomyces hygroscopicus]|uniref:hypothetical protein n=1 Tax=Streptomyces hygroscopicus TaxID=1912 RepID=UPI0036B4E6B6